jgi:hypothetical protein
MAGIVMAAQPEEDVEALLIVSPTYYTSKTASGGPA